MTRSRLTTAAPLLLIGALAALTLWLDRLAQGPERDVIGPSRHDPDYIVDKLAGVRIGPAGAPAYTLAAVKMVHYPDDDTTLLTDPRFVTYRSAMAPVTITASEAVVSARGDHVYFQDDVRITRPAHADYSELVMRTTFLHVVPEQNLAMTDRPVTVIDDTGKLTAEGLELNGETRVFKLLSKVRVTYEPGKGPSGTAR